MSKRIALTDYVEVDGVDLSSDCRAIGSNFEHERVDVSGFGSTDEFLMGRTTREITATFFSNTASNKSFHVLKYLFESKVIFDIEWIQGAQTASATAPACRGSVQITAFPQQAARGSAVEFDVTFTQAEGDTLTWYDT